ncbi:MAG: tetratricopeptide repeat protein [Acidobacteriota bacterium]
MNAPILVLALLLFQVAPPSELTQGVQLFEAGRLPEARTFFATFLAGNPKSAASAFYLGQIALALKEPDKAVEWLEKAAVLDPDNSDLHRWLARAYGVAASQANEVARVRYARDAKAELDKAVRLDPRNLRAHEDLAEFYLRSPEFLGGSLDKARLEAETARKIDPVAGRMILANIHFTRKDNAKAEEEYKEALREVPKDNRPRIALGFLYQAQQRWEEAFGIFEEALANDPENWNALYQVGKTAALSGQRLDRGEECLKKYLTYTPRSDAPPLSGAWFRLAMVYEKKGDKARAREGYQKSLELDPSNAEVRQGLQRVSS